jgi:WD40 repeat protein/predicted Ser/Thr protein kinase
VGIGPERCANCGSSGAGEGALAGLCPHCLLLLADHGAADDGLEPLTLPALRDLAEDDAFHRGHIVAQRYRLVSLLGRGGMGEVWRAFDFKLRVEVALKRLRSDFLQRADSLEVLRREVRAARQIASLHVCRVFDLVADADHEMVSMEYIEGTTLGALLAERSPLPVREAAEIAAQFLAGLEAIHHAGLVHRDVKPENIMVTSSRRVVLMDFGLAGISTAWSAPTSGGTPAYMPEEQAAPRALGATADVFAAGIVLAEMVFPEGTRSVETRRRLWRMLRTAPHDFPECPWKPVLLRAVARAPEDRYASAGELARALEAVTVQTGTAVVRSPYPGLVSFTEDDGEYFFGREFEVEVLLRKLRQPRLRAIIGPSGAGKSSFVRAGLVPALPDGWSAVVCTPRDRPLAALGESLTGKVNESSEAARFPSSWDDTALVYAAVRWRGRHTQALLIVDQFEELFTLSAVAVQRRFAEVLSRLVLDADVHVLLCLRDDFLLRCHDYEALNPIFSALMPLAAPTGNALRRALVQPALGAGCRFEDERLVDDILDEVAGERGALPLLAFAAARLWEARDRTTGTITRAAYEAIGRVGGALARHADAVLERIGPAHAPIAHELFRNLVTAEGTRAAQDRDELLSIFPAPEQADRVLQLFVDARLLTSFERPAEGSHPLRRRVEIIHESLLTAWPRLVRWREEDAESLRFRDQFRQAARLWDTRGRPVDLLWTGAAFREFEVWKEKYSGGLTAIEQAFARATVDRAGRERMQRRRAVVIAFALLVGVLAVVGKLWFDGRRAEGRANAAAMHAEAQQLFALGQIELDRNPSAALAFALASLERADTRAVREFAVQALWRGPTALVLDDGHALAAPRLGFSPDGKWLAAERGGDEVWLWHEEGGGPRKLPGGVFAGFTGDSRYLAMTADREMRIYDVQSAELVRTVAGGGAWGFVRGQQLITGRVVPHHRGVGYTLSVRVQSVPDGEARPVGTWTIPTSAAWRHVDTDGQRLFVAAAGDVYEFSLTAAGANRRRRLVRTSDPILAIRIHRSRDRLFTWHRSGAVRVWSRSDGTPLRQLQAPALSGVWRVADLSPDGRWLACATGNDQTVHLWDLAGPPDADPLVLRRGEVTAMLGLAFHPDGRWLATQDFLAVTIWPLTRGYASVLRGPRDQLRGDVAFDPQGRWVAAGGQMEPKVWVWPLEYGGRNRVLDSGIGVTFLEVSPNGDILAAATRAGVWLLPIDGGVPRKLPGFEDHMLAVAFDREGRRVVAAGGYDNREEAVARVWDLETGEVQVLDAGDGKGYVSANFLPDGRLLTGGFGGLRLWDATFTGSTVLVDRLVAGWASLDGRHVLAGRASGTSGIPILRPFVYELRTGNLWELTTHGEVTLMAWDGAGTRVVTGSREGVVRFGPFTGEEPHLLFGHQGTVWGIDIDGSNRWIASAGEDRTVRVWPIPEGEPSHKLPYEVLLQRLRSLTNYRVTVDPTAPTGHRLTVAPIQGWRQAPPAW